MKNNVLIIEDDDDLSQLLTLFLEKKGWKSKRISSAKYITQSVADEKPSLVLIDNHLIDGLGINFVCDIKKISPYSTILLMTADDKHVLKHFDGFNDIDGFLIKPFLTSDLDSYMDRIVE